MLVLGVTVTLGSPGVLLSAMMLSASLPCVGCTGDFWLGKLSQYGLTLLGDPGQVPAPLWVQWEG